MFKRYDFRYIPQCGPAIEELNFYVYGKPVRKGFMWRATVHGNLPRLDDIGKSYAKYARHSERLARVRTVKERSGPFQIGWAGRQVFAKSTVVA